jgi:hypothetical protein
VASIPVDIGDLPRDNGDELQSLALELYDAAKVSITGRRELTTPRYFYSDILILIGKVDHALEDPEARSRPIRLCYLSPA